MKFRFGNNQTLDSERRLLLPIKTGLSHVLWLSIEIVPGRTPLLFSKRAIKQLGGIIDTVQDTCHFQRLGLSLRLRTGPTGLYMLDLAQLCEESSRNAMCQHVSEEPISPAITAPPALHAPEPQETGSQNNNCIDSLDCPSLPGCNSCSGSNCQEATSDNDTKQGVFENPVSPSLTANVVEPPRSAAELPSSKPVLLVDSRSRSFTDPQNHGQELGSRRFQIPGPWHAPGASSGSNSVVHPSSVGGHGCARVGSLSGGFRSQVRRQDVCRSSANFSRVGKVVLRSSQGLAEAKAPGPVDLHSQVCGASRADRVQSVGLQPERSPSVGMQAGSRSQGQREASAQPRGRSLGRNRSRQFRRGRSGECPRWPRGSSDHATGAWGNSGAPCVSETLLSEIQECQKDLQEALNTLSAPESLSKPSVQEGLEDQARQLIKQQAPANALKSFLRTVPWHQLASAQSASEAASTQSTTESGCKTPAYVMFGSFHGGIKGVTRVAKEFPWLTRVLTQTLKLTDPHHHFTTVGVSCNTAAPPHRDVHNVHGSTNLIVPLSYPQEGGQIWAAKKAHAQQPEHVVECASKPTPGSLQTLKCPTYLNPHVWHSTMPWRGNRVILIGFSLKTDGELPASDTEWLHQHGFPKPVSPASAQTVVTAEATVSNPSDLRNELQAATAMLQPSGIVSDAHAIASACADAYARAEDAAWAVYQDSQLSYGVPQGEQLDLLEIYANDDSLLTSWVQKLGGRARRFTRADGDLSSPEGQRKLWDLIQQEQPRHIWMTPECRHWCSWNAARSVRGQENLQCKKELEQTHLRLCTKVFEWQQKHKREFHLEQPVSSSMLSQESLQPIVKGSHRVTVHMCAFGLETPVSKRPIKKAVAILSTCVSLIQSLINKQCPGHSSHQPVAGKLRELRGLSVSQFAGSYCRNFARHVAQQIVRQSSGDAFALDAGLPMTRKRFKTSAGTPSAQSHAPVHKRPAESIPGDTTRGQPVRRVEPAIGTAPVELPFEVWQPVFQTASQCVTSRSASHLVSPQDELIGMLQQRVSEIQLLQVFVGKNSRNLQSPLGALPSTVAPLRFSLGSRANKDTGKEQYWSLGLEDRLEMTLERKKLRIEPVDLLITIFGQRKNPGNGMPDTENSASHPSSSSTDPPDSTPNIEGWGPPPIPIHGPAFRNPSKEEKSTLIRAHNNLGHPTPQTFANHLRAAGASSNLIQGALEYQCDSCLESAEPRLQRPSKLPEPREFNDLIGVDGFYFKSRSGYRTYVLHALDEASCFHMGRRAPSRHTSQALEALAGFWLSWAGNPRKIYLDPAGEFRSNEILEHFQGLDIQTFVTAAAWQRGRLERHGHVLKDILHRLDTQMPLVNDSLFDQALLHSYSSKERTSTV